MRTRDVFATDGVLAQYLPGYEPRPGQLEMAQAIEELLTRTAGIEECFGSESLTIEAETGLGKTLAYLVPAVLSPGRIVISTNTRNLQDQILHREIPFLRQYIAPDLKAVCVKGRQNYLCLYRWHQQVAAGQQELFSGSDRERISAWIETTRFGDRAELDWLAGGAPLWQKICCLSHFCPGSDCPEHQRCFLNRLRREAAASKLLVVNHHLLFSDLAIRRNGYGEVLPRYQAVIFDEAHHVEKVATQFFGRSISRYQIRDLAADCERDAIASLGRKQRNSLLPLVQAISGRMEQLAALFPAQKGRFPLRDLLQARPEITRHCDMLGTALDNLAGTLHDLKDGEPWGQYGERARELRQELDFISGCVDMDLPDEEHLHIHWFERTEKNLILSATPVDVAVELQETLFTATPACVFTSATLTTGGDFSYFFSRVGLDGECPALTFPSPFNYRERTLLYLPDDGFPEPSHPAYEEQAHQQMEALIQAAGGRALLLFTSFAAMQSAHAYLDERLDFPLFRQGEMPRHELLERFSRQTDSVLLGVASFWEGVDIPGESLSLVIIDKLPFEVPTDPVIMARINRLKQEGKNGFFSFQVPRAILGLRQGVGRLMRRSSDRGVIAILDIRLLSKGYGKRFMRSLPPSPLVRDIRAVQTFFSQECNDN